MAEFEPATIRRRARPLLRISLAMLMLVIAAIAVWLAWITNRARTQAEVVRELQARNAWFFFDYERPIAAFEKRVNDPPPGPAWIHRVLGDEYNRKLSFVSWHEDSRTVPRKLEASYRGPRRDDDLLRKLASLSGIESLSVGQTEVSDQGLANVSRMRGLLMLEVYRSPNVTDASFAHVRSLPKLERLVIQDCRISDRTLAFVAGSPSLKLLYVQSALITDAGLAHLRTIPSLQDLSVESPAITDAGLAHLRGLANLEGIHLRSPLITDVGLAELAALGRFRSLGLQDALITDAGVAQVAKLDKLHSLWLSSSGPPLTDRALVLLGTLPELVSLSLGNPQGTCTHFSDAAILELVKSLPKLRALMLEPPNLDPKFVKQLQQARPGLQVGRVPR